MLQYYTSFFMQNIFSLRKYRVTTIGYNIFYIISQKKELLFQKIIHIVSKCWSEKSDAQRPDAVSTSPPPHATWTGLANCARLLSCKFRWSIRRAFRSHRNCAKSQHKCLFVLRQIETEKLTRNKSVRKSIHTNECQIKAGCLIFKRPVDKTVNIQRFEFKLSTIFDRISSFHETKEWILRSPFPFCLPSLNLPVSFDWAGWRQYWHCNTLLFLFSDISTFAQLTMAARRGGEEAAYQIPSAPLPPALTSITRLQLSFLPDVWFPQIFTIQVARQCSNCLFWQPSPQRDRVRVRLIEGKIPGLRQETRS